jgi:hypothetical protein
VLGCRRPQGIERRYKFRDTLPAITWLSGIYAFAAYLLEPNIELDPAKPFSLSGPLLKGLAFYYLGVAVGMTVRRIITSLLEQLRDNTAMLYRLGILTISLIVVLTSVAFYVAVFMAYFYQKIPRAVWRRATDIRSDTPKE